MIKNLTDSTPTQAPSFLQQIWSGISKCFVSSYTTYAVDVYVLREGATTTTKDDYRLESSWSNLRCHKETKIWQIKRIETLTRPCPYPGASADVAMLIPSSEDWVPLTNEELEYIEEHLHSGRKMQFYFEK